MKSSGTRTTDLYTYVEAFPVLAALFLVLASFGRAVVKWLLGILL